jgi:hypothetical protein
VAAWFTTEVSELLLDGVEGADGVGLGSCLGLDRDGGGACLGQFGDEGVDGVLVGAEGDGEGITAHGSEAASYSADAAVAADDQQDIGPRPGFGSSVATESSDRWLDMTRTFVLHSSRSKRTGVRIPNALFRANRTAG